MADRTTGSITINVSATAGAIRQENNRTWTTAIDAAQTLSSINAALSLLPRQIDHAVRIVCGAGVAAQTFEARSFYGAGSITITGNLSNVTPTSGVATGTAGSGTSSTALKKPAAAANWTANDLQGRLLVITGGGGSGETRAILANTTDTITVHAITGLDDTSEFSIQEPDTTITLGTLDGCKVPVTVDGFTVTRLVTDDNRNATLKRSIAPTYNADGAIDSDLDRRLNVVDCVLKTNGNIVTDSSEHVTVNRVLLHDGSCTVENAMVATTEIEARSCDQTALYLSANKAKIGFNAVSCTATPLQLVDCNSAEPYGTGIAGTSNTGDYGVIISGNTHFDTVGNTTLSGGTSDMSIEGVATTYAAAQASGGAVMENRASVVVSNGVGMLTSKAIYGLRDFVLSGSHLFYGLFRGPYASMTATGSAYGDALAQALYYKGEISGGAANTGIRLWSTPAVAGMVSEVVNTSGSDKILYPGDANHTINGGSAGAGVTLTNGQVAFCRSTSATNWRVVIR